ncbi:MAG: TRAP transporter substrate-binding protein [Hyphomicrobiales bacterium]|nr:TRAP transporter substrate-binding protein [Hyphomicrobiales bacterium]
MNRHKFLAATGAVAAAFPTPAFSQNKNEIRLVTTWPKGSGLNNAAERLGNRITKISEGRLQVTTYAAGELVEPLDSFDAVSSGDVEMYHAAEIYWGDKHKAFPFYTGVPVGMTTHEIEAWVHVGGGQELWDELSAQFGIKLLLAGNTGVQMGGWFQEPIKSVDQIKSLKMRIPGLGGEVIRRLGGEVVNLPGSEILGALQSGRLNAAEWNSPWLDMEFGIHTVLKTYMFPGFHEPGTGQSLGINKAFWDGLTDTDREIIKASASAENDILMAQFNAKNGIALGQLVEKQGVKLSIFPKEVWTEFAKVSREVIMEIGDVDLLGARILQSWLRFQKRVSEWQQISDISYTAFRSIALRY